MFNSKSKNFSLLLIALILILGLSPLVIKKSSALAQYNGTGQSVELRGVVIEEPDVRVNHVKLIVLADSPAPGKVLVNTSLYPRYEYGDELKISCALETPEPFEGFAYDKYLAKDKIYSVCGYARVYLLSRGNGDWLKTKIFGFKNKVQDTINSSLPEPQASILSAVTIANRRLIPDSVVEYFNITGTTHLMAISGLHISILITVFMQICLFFYIPKKYSFWLATFVLIFYITMIGFPPSAVRAGIMGWLVLLAFQVGRLSNSINALLLAAVVMLTLNQNLLLYDIGFQLSFSAVLGIMYFYGLFEKLFWRLPELLGLRSSMAMTMSAQISTTPLIVFYFERLSLIAPLANFVILPALPYLMVARFFGTLMSLMLPQLSLYIFWPALMVLNYILMSVQQLSKITYSSIIF